MRLLCIIKVAFSATLAILSSACSKVPPQETGSTIIATIRNPFGGWKEGDKLAVIDPSGLKQFALTGNPQGSSTASFSGTADNSSNWIIRYPYGTDIDCKGYKIHARIPQEQKAVSDGVEDGLRIAAGKVSGSSVEKKVELSTLCAYIKIQLISNGVRTITLTAGGTDKLAGRMEIDCTYTPRISSIADGSGSVTLKPYLRESLLPGTYYFTVLPGTLSNGFTITLTDSKDRSGAKEYSNVVTVNCNQVYSLGSIDAREIIGTSEDADPEAETELFNAANRALMKTFLEEYLSVKDKAASADSYLESQLEDGSWADVKYDDPARSSWDACKHINRTVMFACAYHLTQDSKYLTGMAKALHYWASTKPKCNNWWYNEINDPKVLGPALLLVREDLSRSMLEDAFWVMDQATICKTGQNKVWESGNVLMTAILKRDEALAKKAHASMLEEITVVPANKTLEGIQYDWSFHQHGAQLQFGNYGLSFLTDFADWFKAWKGTCLEVSGEKLEIMENYVYNGMEWILWKNHFDHNACGRQVTRNAQTTKCRNASNAIVKMGLELRSPIGAKYYPKSDFGVYRTKDWYASVRMQSNRTIGFEMTNNENLKGYFCADGATLVRRNGDEYFNVSPVWNWRHVPGVTCYDNGKVLSGMMGAKQPYNSSGNVFGLADGENLVLGMEILRDGLKAYKAWFFCPQGYVCLGTAISMGAGYPVTTGVQQCRVNGMAIEDSGTWIKHNGITYVPIDGKFNLSSESRTGNWNEIHITGSGSEKMDIMDIYIDHGVNPALASYAYLVVPTDVPGTTAASYVGKEVQVMENSTSMQKVCMFGRTMTVNWSSLQATVE